MNLERFRTLAEAFGGSVTRWPLDDQDAAYALLAGAPDEAGLILAEARDLDADLDAAERLAPSHALRQRIIAAAPRPRETFSRFRRWLTGAGVGVGLAAATAAGMVAGINMAAASAGEDALLLAAVYGSGLMGEPGGAS